MSRKIADAHTLTHFAAALFCGLFAITCFVAFHDAPSYLPDDGVYAFSAQRIVDGFQQPDAPMPVIGYGDLPNALALAVFGERLVSIRYPLLLVMIFNALLAFGLLRERLGDAVLASVLVSGLTLVLFMHPSRGWFCLSVALAIVGVLTWARQLDRKTFLLLGVLVGMAFFTRSLSGAIIAAGTFAITLERLAGERPGDRALMVRAALIPVFLVLGFVTLRAGSLGSWILLAAWPASMTVAYWWRLRARNRDVIGFCLWFALGFILSGLPLHLYHFGAGSFLEWLDLTFYRSLNVEWGGAAVAETFGAMPLSILESVVAAGSPRALLNGLFWLVMLFSPMLLGVLLLRKFRLDQEGSLPPVAIMASFFAVSALHLQIPYYLFYVSALPMIGVLAIGRNAPGTAGLVLRGLLLVTLVVGLRDHAGRPHGNDLDSWWTGKRDEASENCGLDRSGLRFTAEGCARYVTLVRMVQEHAEVGQMVWTVPNGIELNFLADRPYPMAYLNCPLQVVDDRDLEYWLAEFQRHPPALIVDRAGDKYDSRRCRVLTNTVRDAYRLVGTVDGYEVLALIDGSDGYDRRR